MNNIAKILSFLALCSLGALAISHQKMREYEFERTALYYRRDAPSNSAWTNIGTPESDELVTFTLYLKQKNLHLLEAALLADSDPHSALYGKHWSRQEILDLVAPSQRVQKEVLTWLYFVADVVGQEHLVSLTNAQDAIQVVASVKYTEKLFATQLFKFEHVEMNKHGIKHLGELSVPRSLASYIDIITGVTDFLPFNKNLKQWTAAPEDMNNQCNVPYTIKQLYNIPLDLTVTNVNANQSIYAEAFQSGEGFGFGSIAYWEQANGIPSNPINCILGDGAGLIFPNDTDDEAQLDTQMMTGMAVGAKTCFWIIEGWMLDFAEQMFANPNTPLVISASYGWTEWDQCDNATEGSSGLGNCSAIHIPNSQQYVNRTNVEFQKIGLTGRTIVVASGDDGNAGGHSSPNGCTKIAPMFPAASPWVLTVGATSVEPSSTSASFAAGTQPPLCTNAQYSCVCSTSTNEQPAQGNNTAGFDSGGGFSVYSPTPSYQKKAVAGYLASGIYLPPSSYGWNSQGRGYPDVAAVGENFCVVDPGTPCNLAAGTSASAPLIASVMTLLNQDRLNAGKASLGFVNPVIYDMYDESPTQYFNNEFAGTNGGECGTSFGFHSKAGMWSPISGVGSPKFDQIRTYINSLP